MMEEYHGQTPNSFGSPSEWEDGIIGEEGLRSSFEITLSAMPEGSERDRIIELIKAQAFIDGLVDVARVREIYEDALTRITNQKEE